MPCKTDNVFHLLDGELTNAEASLVREHFDGCIACGTLHEELAPLYKAFRKLSPPDLRPYEIARLKQRILEGGPLSRLPVVDPERPGRLRSRGKGWKKAVSAMLLITFLLASLACAYLAGMIAGTRFQPVCPQAVIPRASTSKPARPLPTEAPSARPTQSAGAVAPQTPFIVDGVTSGGVRVVWSFDL